MLQGLTPSEVPDSIISWVKDPKLDMYWAQAILGVMEKRGVEVVTPY